jgi:arylsulfatase A-like enzyme
MAHSHESDRDRSTTRRDFLKRAGATALSAGSLSLLSGLAAQGNGRPNVILVMTDDQGYGDVGAHGNPYLKTPTLDRLYGESVRLTNFHTDPCCSPTRAALLTGQYSDRSGVWHTIGGRSLLRKEKVTMGDVFHAGGYRTGIFGKWHLGDNYPFSPQYRGFDETVVHRGGVVGTSPDHWGNDYYDDVYYRNGEPKRFEGYCNTVWFDQAIRFIRENRRRPFFCFLPTNLPHAPLRVDEEYVKPYKSMVSDQIANYYGMLTKFDEDMAKLLKEIEDLGLEENTIFIFMGDNGPCPWFGGIKIDSKGFPTEGYSAGMRGGKIWGYENAHRVPCYIRWPKGGITGGKDVTRLTAHFDLLPTLIDLCGLRRPKEVEFDGKSLVPLLLNPAAQWKERTLFVHNQRVYFPVKYKQYQVLTERWRLINPRQKESNEWELYDILADPGQRKDIAGEHPEVVQQLHKEYEAWWADLSQHHDGYSPIIIGSETENPTTLFGHDAHRYRGQFLWIVEAEQDGEYEFRLRRWPEEANKRIAEDRAGNVESRIRGGRLVIGNSDQTKRMTPDLKALPFTVYLKAGLTCVQGWFTTDDPTKNVNAGYVGVERIGPADRERTAGYQGTHPDTLLRT